MTSVRKVRTPCVKDIMDHVLNSFKLAKVSNWKFIITIYCKVVRVIFYYIKTCLVRIVAVMFNVTQVHSPLACLCYLDLIIVISEGSGISRSELLETFYNVQSETPH